MKYLLIVLLTIPTLAHAKAVNFTDGDKSTTISISAQVMSFQTITEKGECFFNGEEIDCEEIGGFIEPANTDLTTTEKKDSPNGNFQ
jgi:hypothetical protein